MSISSSSEGCFLTHMSTVDRPQIQPLAVGILGDLGDCAVGCAVSTVSGPALSSYSSYARIGRYSLWQLEFWEIRETVRLAVQ